MRRLRYLAIVLVVAGLTALPSFAGGNANFILGMRSLGDDPWEELDLDQQPVFGADVSFGNDAWPILLEASFHASSKEEDFGPGDVTGTVSEFAFGVNKGWNLSDGMHPYVGGGLSYVNAELELDAPGFNDSEDDNSTALYVHGGIFWRIGPRFNIGADARFLTGSDLEVLGVEFDADYFQAGVLLGWGWPASK